MNVLKCASCEIKICNFYNYCNRHLCAFVGGIKNKKSKNIVHTTNTFHTVRKLNWFFVCSEFNFGKIYYCFIDTIILLNKKRKNLVSTTTKTEHLLLLRNYIGLN